jgi:pimeloyl-ACP methyl ester carboxylesterase
MSTQKSTIDRFSGMALVRPSLPPRPRRPRRPLAAFPSVPLLRAGFTALERRPGLGGIVAERLWFRLPAGPSEADRARRTPPGGEAFETRWSGGTVRGRVYGDWGRPTAYLVHGWGGWWQQLSAHVEPLVDRGLCVVAVDLPSHGGSEPGRHGRRSTTFLEMGEALGAVIADFGRPALVVAHSAGAVATMLAVDEGAPVESLVLLAPPISVPPMMRVFADALAIGPRSQAVMVARTERRVGLPLDAVDLVGLASRQPSLPPLLVVHDRGDREAPFSGAVELVTAWNGARLVPTDGLGHHRVMWDPAVVGQVAAVAAEAVRAAGTAQAGTAGTAGVRRSSR